MNALRLHAVVRRPSAGALYRAVWRWHCYAGLLVAPFALFLAVTGTMYLWRPQYEAWRYEKLLRVPVGAGSVTPDVQFKAACASQPWWATPVSFTPSLAPGRTSETIFRMERGALLSVFVNPHNGVVVGARLESDRAMNRLRELHGELLSGANGRMLVELAASWMCVLLLTGLYLWWPRPRFEIFGFLLPRLRATGREFWRDLHAVPAVWFSIGALFQLVTGMPGTKVAGAWLQTIATAIGEGSPKPRQTTPFRSELIGWTPPPPPKTGQPVDAHAGASPVFGLGSALTTVDRQLAPGIIAPPPISLERVVAIAKQQQVHGPYAIGFAGGPTDVIRVLSDRNLTYDYTYLQLDQYTGRVLSNLSYSDYGAMGRLFLWSGVAHEGRLFGLASQIFGTFACLGIFLMAASATVLWWQRRPGKVRLSTAPLPRAVFVGTLVLSVVLPLLAASVAVLFVIDRLLAWRISWGRLSAEPALR